MGKSEFLVEYVDIVMARELTSPLLIVSIWSFSIRGALCQNSVLWGVSEEVDFLSLLSLV